MKIGRVSNPEFVFTYVVKLKMNISLNQRPRRGRTYLLLLPALPPLEAWTRMATATSTMTTRTPAPTPSSVSIHGFISRPCSLLSKTAEVSFESVLMIGCLIAFHIFEGPTIVDKDRPEIKMVHSFDFIGEVRINLS